MYVSTNLHCFQLLRYIDQDSISDTFNITVTPVNDAPVINDTVFSLKENSPNNTIVDTVVATDVDEGDELSYIIMNGNNGNAFAIHSFIGTLTVNDYSELDFETIPVFNLTVQVQDNGEGYLTDTATITVNLTDELLHRNDLG